METQVLFFSFVFFAFFPFFFKSESKLSSSRLQLLEDPGSRTKFTKLQVTVFGIHPVQDTSLWRYRSQSTESLSQAFYVPDYSFLNSPCSNSQFTKIQAQFTEFHSQASCAPGYSFWNSPFPDPSLWRFRFQSTEFLNQAFLSSRLQLLEFSLF